MGILFVRDQSVGFKNHVENIAIVGAGGRSGSFIADALIRGKKHRVTAITRSDSTNKMLPGLHDIKQVDYSNHASIVKALKGQEVLIITMNVMANKESQTKLIDAAVEAGVKWIMPNEWGVDLSKVEMSKDCMLRDRLVPVREYIEKAGTDKTRWIGLCCGFWYEFSLAGTEARYGFDFDKKTLTLYDDGNTKINTSTWPQFGRAVASLLSLKILPEDEKDKSPCLSQYNNKSAHVSSFFVSQKDMFESVLRVTGDDEKAWKITHEDIVERYNRAQQMVKEGKMLGFLLTLYSRIFYKDGAGDFNGNLDNDVLGLPKEDLDEATKVAVNMALSGDTNAVE
ncbi:hypothetical protein H2198_002748 [Neophaeococcomyces mojaviensis]|uniref:Uncharacterized protein n=1 Tax=Neophaeococcomyces mojaviensis TaxID=3383035 RepID=A0ACC3AD53_9EURO|nr:hypothetical protein H2198_002748 [Knufia sp. JES_112]